MDTTRPYEAAAMAYRRAGWLCPLPLPVRAKASPPKDYTGWTGVIPSGADVQAWADGREGAGNIALRMPDDVIVIDVDAYNGKPGAERFASLGLPVTWTSTSRGADSDARHHFYRYDPADLAGRVWDNHPTGNDSGLDTLHYGHRYSMVWPSVHPSGATVTWYDPEREAYEGVPEKGWLAKLTTEQVHALSHEGAPLVGTAAPQAEVQALLAVWRERAEPPCTPVLRALMRERERFARAEQGEALHQPAPLHHLVCLGLEGHAGVYAALAEHLQMHVQVATTTARRTESDAGAEWWRMVLGSVGKKLAATGGAYQRECGCQMNYGTEEAPIAAPVTEDSLAFTDAHVSELVVDQLLTGLFLNVPGVSWFMWDSPVWREVPEATLIEHIRLYVVGKVAFYDRAKAEAAAKGDHKGSDRADESSRKWFGYCSAAKLKALATLTVGQAAVAAEASDFDRDHHLLNTPTGVVDLRTGAVMPADPAFRMTKVTSVGYVPGAEHPAFKLALTSIPDGCETWLQDRMGQAITGEHPDDGRFVLLTGGGANGKTTLMGAVMGALRPEQGADEQGYGRLIPSELLLKATGAAKDGATPTKMTLQGTRFGYFEETPEGRYLDVTSVKSIMDTRTITGRQLFQRQITFGTTHSLFLNTNYPPLVEETGHGEWRRLVRIEFPYTFVSQRRADEHGLRDGERVGSPTIKTDLATREAREAALAWLVTGAMRFYARGATLPGVDDDPNAVRQATADWRESSDVILQFLRECMVPLMDGRDRWVERGELYAAYRLWMQERGNKPLAMGKLIDRLTGHSALGWVTVTKRKAADPLRSALPTRDTWLASAAPTSPFTKPDSSGRVHAVTGLAFVS